MRAMFPTAFTQSSFTHAAVIIKQENKDGSERWCEVEMGDHDHLFASWLGWGKDDDRSDETPIGKALQMVCHPTTRTKAMEKYGDLHYIGTARRNWDFNKTVTEAKCVANKITCKLDNKYSLLLHNCQTTALEVILHICRYSKAAR